MDHGAESSVDGERLLIVARVDRANEDHEWSGWAATREDAAALVVQVGEVLESANKTPFECKIQVPGYERDFLGAEELVENVDENEWVALASMRFAWWPKAYGDQYVRASLYLQYLGRASILNQAVLTVSGGDRRGRNAVEPDLAEIVERHARTQPSRGRIKAAVFTPMFVAYLLFTVALSFLLQALDASVLAVSLAYTGEVLAIWAAGFLLVPRTLERIDHALVGVELLPESGESRWDTAKAALTKSARIAFSAIILVATVVGAVAAVIAAA